MKEINYLNAMKLINCDSFNELEDDEYLKKFMVFINKHKELFSYAIEKDSSRFILKMINNGFEIPEEYNLQFQNNPDNDIDKEKGIKYVEMFKNNI